ncbi:MAG: T9SS type A sorting domain-containing protein [Bacteroidales bacterium]|nr:T9SS type A sorting domain-containing protein [Bacteroidales bacterium]
MAYRKPVPVRQPLHLDWYGLIRIRNNSTTTIEYELLSTEWVKLMIYNHFGQQLEVLVNIQQAKGAHKIAWDSADLPAGIYYCQLRAGNQLISKKIIKIN